MRNPRKSVWFYNRMEKGYMDFWDYWSLVEEEDSLITALNQLETEDTEAVENIIAAYIYWCYDNHKKLDVGQISRLLTLVNCDGLSKTRFVTRTCLGLLKKELHKKDFVGCQQIVSVAKL